MNGGVWAENGLLGTPAFINVPETEVLSDEEISQIAKEIETLNDAQVSRTFLSCRHFSLP